MPAYQELKRSCMDPCGLTQLASRTVGVPFVGLVAGCLVISELLPPSPWWTSPGIPVRFYCSLYDIEAGFSKPPYSFGLVMVGG